MDMSRVSTCTIPMHDREIAYALQAVTEAGFTKTDILALMPYFSADQGLCDWSGMRDLARLRYRVREFFNAGRMLPRLSRSLPTSSRVPHTRLSGAYILAWKPCGLYRGRAAAGSAPVRERQLAVFRSAI